MINCPSCKKQVGELESVCSNCGISLVYKCSKCGERYYLAESTVDENGSQQCPRCFPGENYKLISEIESNSKDDSCSETSKPEYIKGKRIVLAIIIAFLSVSILTILFYIFGIGFGKIYTQIVRLILNIVLCAYLYSGSRTARIITITLLSISIVIGLFGVISLSITNTLASIPFLVMILFYAVLLILLTLNSNVKIFFNESIRTSDKK